MHQSTLSKAIIAAFFCALGFCINSAMAQSSNLVALVHRYSFSETNGTTITDSVGGSAWNGVLPNGGTFSNGTLTLSPASQQYANLPGGIVSTLSNATIVAWVNLDSVSTWNRIFDFGNNTSNYMFLTPSCGGAGTLRFAITTNGTGNEQQINCGSTLSIRTWHQVAVTLTPGNGVLYLDGIAMGTNTSMALNPTSLGVTINNYLGKSQFADPYLSGQFDEFRIYNGAMSAFQIAQIYALGPNQFSPSATIDPTTTYQTIEGLGGATAFWMGNITSQPYKQEIYTNAFAGLNLSMLRLGDWYSYQTPLAGFDSSATEIVSNAGRILGHPVQVYMSSWSPPAFLKNNGQYGNGTLLFTNGSYDYAGFAQYWHDSIQAYRSNGISPTWISIQNEPDFNADYGSCLLLPTENENGNTNGSYSNALDAVCQLITNLPSPPKILAPECVHISFGDLGAYGPTLNSNSFYGINHHLYGDGGSTGDSYLPALSVAASVDPNRPHFMTEYGGVTNMIECANLIHDELTVEQVSGYNHWSLIYPGGGGLINLENSNDPSTWTNAPPGFPEPHGWWYSPCYWSMKHFSYFIQPGFKRVSATDSDVDVRVSAYLSPDGLRLVAVFINTNAVLSSTLPLGYGSFPAGISGVYQTVGTNYFQYLGSINNSQVALPPLSITTVVLDQIVSVGSATNPSPANNGSGVALSATLNWSPGSNALMHVIYLGTNSNAVAQATTVSPEFQAILATNSFLPATLAQRTTYFWRVDEVAEGNTNTGAVWSFTTLTVPTVLVHRYSFSESGGSNTADSVGGPAWNGTLPKGGILTNGTLTLTGSRSQYVLLPPGILSNYTAVTIDLWATIQTGLPTYCYLYSFGNTDSSGAGYDYIFLSPQFSRITISAVDPGYNGEQGGDFPTLAGATNMHVTSVFNPPGGFINVYTNGVLSATFTGITDSMSMVAPQLAYIGRSLYTADSYFTATYDEFRIYNGVLGTNDIAASQALGPNQLLSSSSPTVGAVVSGSNLTLTWPLASSGFTVLTTTNLADGNWTPAVATPQIVGSQWQVILPATNAAQFFQLRR